MKDFRYSGWLMPGRAALKDAVSPGDVIEVHEVVRRAQMRLHRTKKKKKVPTGCLCRFLISVSLCWTTRSNMTSLINQSSSVSIASKGQPLLYGQTVHQTLELLLAQFDFILKLALLDDERRLHLDKVLVVRKAVLLQAVAQDLVNRAFSAVQVLLQLLRVLVLSNQQLSLLNQCTLWMKETY